MTSVTRNILSAAVCAAFVAACGPTEPSIVEKCKSRLPGDLVISEFIPDPDGIDTGHEWIELYNATGAPLDLKGMSLIHAAVDGTGEKEYVFNASEVAAGAYFVVGDVRAEPLPAHVNYSYGDKLGALRNQGGMLAIRCGTKVIDEVKYSKAASPARSLQLDGKLVPDSANNDVEAQFCAGRTAIAGTRNFGTPGHPNTPCGSTGASTCLDPFTQTSRATVPPKPGELVITEMMPDPRAVPDTEGEWFEVYAHSTVDLNGLTVLSGAGKSTLGSETCLQVGTGTYAVIARNPDVTTNGGIPEVTATTTVSMSNASGNLALVVGEATVIDEVTWTGATPGTSLQLNPDYLDAALNDEPTLFCKAEVGYGAGDLGTPGTANTACPPFVPQGSCFDPETGEVRSIQKPLAGELVITEVMTDPKAVSDTEGEWFEIYAANSVDLNDLEIGVNTTSPDVVRSTDCIHLEKGTYGLIARNTDPAVNGGLPYVTYKTKVSLTNSNSTLAIRSGALLIDQVTWTTSTSGRATQLNPMTTDAVSNDDPANFCPAEGMYGEGGDFGSPGAENPACGASATQCFDPDSQMNRDIVFPQGGDLVITEVMPDPSGNGTVADTSGEWFELLVKADVDLNNLQLANEGSGNTTIKAANCLRPGAGAYVVFARKADATLNGGLPAVTGTFSFGLGNFGSTATPRKVIVRRDSFVLDEITWTSSTPGVSAQLSSDRLDASSNNDPANFCPSPETATFGAGDRGTPAAINALCQ